MEGPVQYKLSAHAQKEIERRGIPLAVVEAVLEKPDQVVPERGILKACQSKCEIGGNIYLVHIIIDDSVTPMVVITAYRTTKIEKYWGKP